MSSHGSIFGVLIITDINKSENELSYIKRKYHKLSQKSESNEQQ